MSEFHGQVLPAIERALISDLPDVEEKRRKPGSQPGPDAEMMTVKRRPYRHEVEIYAFPQSWSDTSLGFGGMAGQAFTSAYTTVVISDHLHAAVYVGGRLAYLAEVTNEFMDDVSNHRMLGVCDGPSKKYKLLRKTKADAI